jgi:hypothetical protein
MQLFTIRFFASDNPKDHVTEILISRESEVEAIQAASSLFAARYPDKRVEDHAVRSVPEGS